MAAHKALQAATRTFMHEEGSRVKKDSDAAEVESAAATFFPPIRRSALATLVLDLVASRMVAEVQGASMALVQQEQLEKEQLEKEQLEKVESGYVSDSDRPGAVLEGVHSTTRRKRRVSC
jgi:hypothetical protein